MKVQAMNLKESMQRLQGGLKGGAGGRNVVINYNAKN